MSPYSFSSQTHSARLHLVSNSKRTYPRGEELKLTSNTLTNITRNAAPPAQLLGTARRPRRTLPDAGALGLVGATGYAADRVIIDGDTIRPVLAALVGVVDVGAAGGAAGARVAAVQEREGVDGAAEKICIGGGEVAGVGGKKRVDVALLRWEELSSVRSEEEEPRNTGTGANAKWCARILSLEPGASLRMAVGRASRSADEAVCARASNGSAADGFMAADNTFWRPP